MSGAEDAIARAADALEANGIEYMLVGAFAVFAHGDPRTSRDVDIVIDARGRDARELQRVLTGSGLDVEGPTQDEFGRKFVVPIGDTPVELYYAIGGQHREREFSRRVRVQYGECAYPVMSAEDLVLWKLIALLNRRSQNDFLDVNGILVKQWVVFDFEYVRARADRRARIIFEDIARHAKEARERMGLPT